MTATSVFVRPELTTYFLNPFTPYPPQAGRNLKIAAGHCGGSKLGLWIVQTTEATMNKQDELVVITRNCNLERQSNETLRQPLAQSEAVPVYALFAN